MGLKLLRRSARFAPTVLAMGVLAAVSAAQPTSSADAYCGIKVPADTDCANVAGGSWYNGFFNTNVASHPGGGGLWVCAHTYLRGGGGGSVARTCGPNSAVNDYEELGLYYNDHTELSGHAGNDASVEMTIDGEAFVAG